MAYSRREFLEWSGVMGAAAFAAPLYVSAAEASRREPVKYEKGLAQPAFLHACLWVRFVPRDGCASA